MKSFIKLNILLVSIACILSACGDDNGPIITIDSPIENANYNIGDTLIISGNVTDDIMIDSVIFFAANLLTASLDINSVTDLSDIDFEADLILDSTVVRGEYTLEITSYDNEDNNTMKSIDFSVN